MKKLLPFLLLACGIANAEIVTFADPNFKAKVLSSTNSYNLAGVIAPVDTNSNGEIELSEAAAISSLDVDRGNISNLSGIEAFVNLKFLSCAFNNLTSLSLQNFTQLSGLTCDHNALTSLQISGCDNLVAVFCDNNELTSLTLSGFPLLSTVECSSNDIATLNTSNCPNMHDVLIEGNPLVSVDFSNCPMMSSLSLSNYDTVTSVNVTNCSSMSFLNVNGTRITTLSLQAVSNLTYFSAENTPLLTSITNINCPRATTFLCGNNNISSIDLSSLRNVTSLNCSNTLVTTLDISSLPNLSRADFSSNPLLETIFAKNGNTTEILDWTDTPNLIFICADEGQVASIQTALSNAGNVTTVVNSFCTFVPGGNHNTITGTARFDANSNGCDASDVVMPNIRVNITDGTNQGANFTNAQGEYQLHTSSGNFTVAPTVENPSWFTFSPASAVIPFANANNNTTTQNFCIAPNGTHQDLEIVIQPIAVARPGFDATYRIVYRNKGNTTVSGNINFTFNDSKLDFITATETPNTVTAGSLSWNYSNLIPFESRSIFITLNVNSPVETPAVNIDDVLTFGSTISPTAADEVLQDNSFTYNQLVVGAYDPNDITCIEGNLVPPSEIGRYLHYAVNFENTGNYMAQNVVVRDVVDITKYDISTLQLQNTSHPSYTRITGNMVEFIFQDINLAAASGTPRIGSHGDVLFKIKSKSSLVEGNFVSKSAKIYFDYNAPITTNDEQTVFRNLSNTVHQWDNSISAYPNPANSVINIRCSSTINSIQLYDVQGRLLETNFADAGTAVFDISSRQNGLYFLKVTTDNGSKIEKIVKQ